MKIGVLSHLYPSVEQQNAGSFIKNQLDCLAKHLDIRLFAPRVPRHWFRHPVPDDKPKYPVIQTRILVIPSVVFQRINPPLAACFLRKKIQSFFEQCDLVHAHFAFWECGAAVRVYGGKKPIVVTVHGTDIHDFAFRKNLRDEIIHSLNSVQYIIAVSDSLAAKLDELGVTSPKVVIPNGIDTSLFVPGSKKDACLRLGLDPLRPRLLYAGNFNTVKNLEQLIRVLPYLLKQHPALELVLAGATAGNPMTPRYRALAKELGVEQSMTIKSMVPHHEMPDIFRSSDIFVLSSLNEGFGLVLAESLACGRPVVATRCGGPEQIIEKGMGCLVPLNDDHAFAEAILKTLDGIGVLSAEELAQSAHRRFSFELVTERILEVYRTVVGDFGNRK
jgi:teichuronic acid biosynthesis glycosyltransferase TuaC